MTFDLDALSEQLTHNVDVDFDDDGNATAGFVIVGRDSQQYRAKYSQLRQTGIKRAAQKGKTIDTKTDEGAEEMDRLMQINDMEIALAVTVDWFGFAKAGQPVPFSKDALRSVLTARPTWREKISAALENEAHFLPKSPKPSAATLVTNSD